MFKQVLKTQSGIDDFTASRDLYANTCLHYLALFDEEDFIISVLEHVAKSQEFALKLKNIADANNTEMRKPMDFFERGKSESYITLHEALQGVCVGQNLSNTELSFIV